MFLRKSPLVISCYINMFDMFFFPHNISKATAEVKTRWRKPSCFGKTKAKGGTHEWRSNFDNSLVYTQHVVGIDNMCWGSGNHYFFW